MTDHEMPIAVNGIVLTLVLVAGMWALGWAIAVGSGANLTRVWPLRAVGAVIGMGVVYLVVYAGTMDGYYGSGVTRWEHAGRWGSRPFVSLAVALAVAAILAQVLRPQRRWRALAFALSAIACAALIVAWIALTGGH